MGRGGLNDREAWRTRVRFGGRDGGGDNWGVRRRRQCRRAKTVLAGLITARGGYHSVGAAGVATLAVSGLYSGVVAEKLRPIAC